MSCPSQLRFLRQALQQQPGRVLYSGAAAGDAQFAPLFPGAVLHTTDIQPAPGVDIVWGFHAVAKEGHSSEGMPLKRRLLPLLLLHNLRRKP
jgi:hypothetical protein